MTENLIPSPDFTDLTYFTPFRATLTVDAGKLTVTSDAGQKGGVYIGTDADTAPAPSLADLPAGAYDFTVTVDSYGAGQITAYAQGSLKSDKFGDPTDLAITGPGEWSQTFHVTDTTAGAGSVFLRTTQLGDAFTISAPSLVAQSAPPPATTVVVDAVTAGPLTVGTPATVELTGTTDADPATLTWTVTAGQLPAGLQLDPAGTIAGTPTGEGTGTVTLTATNVDGNTDATDWTWTVEPADPGPGPGPDPGDELAQLVDELAPLVAGFVARPDDADTLTTARAQLPVVVEFVKAYTRGHGWGVDRDSYTPTPSLRAVLVSAAARLVVNPTQVKQYSIADYSESSPVLTAYTLAERGVLHRYRRTSA